MRKSFGWVAIALMVMLGLAMLPGLAHAQTPDRLDAVLKSGVLRVGTSMDTPPFSMRQPDGGLEGFDIDALASLGKALGVKIEYVKTSFGSLLTDLTADKFDIAMSGMGKTYDRARVGVFSEPYLRYGKLLMIRATDKGKFKSFADLDKPGIRVAYNEGGLNDKFAHTEFKQATPVGFTSNGLATPALLAGKVDVEVTDSTAGLYDTRRDPRLAVVDPAHPFNPIYVGILLHRNDQTLLNFINLWIDQVKLDGSLAKIQAKWIGPDK